MKQFIFGLLLFFLNACTHLPPQTTSVEPAKQRFAGVDIYGTDRLSVDEVKSLLEPCVPKYLAGDFEKFFTCKADLIAKLQARFHFAYLDLSLIGYFHPGDRPLYGTFDAVEPGDAKARMNYIQRPGESFSDPDGLFQAWDDISTPRFGPMKRSLLTV